MFRDLPGITRDQYTVAQNAWPGPPAAAAPTTARSGIWEDSFSSQAICIFDVESACEVAAINVRVGVPATDVAEAIDLHAAS